MVPFVGLEPQAVSQRWGRDAGFAYAPFFFLYLGDHLLMSVSIATLTWPTSPHSTLALAEEMGGGEAVVLFFSPFISYSRRANHGVVTNRLASSETRQQF